MNFNVQFIRPKELPDPMPNYQEMITGLQNHFGKETLIQHIELISKEWALDSGYYFHIKDGRHLFIHVSLNEKDYL